MALVAMTCSFFICGMASPDRDVTMPTPTPTLEITPAVLTTEQAAAYLGVAAQSLENWRSTRRYALPYVKIGGRVRYRKADLDAWIESRVVEA